MSNCYEYQQILQAMINKYGMDYLDHLDPEDIVELYSQEEFRNEMY